MSEHGLFGAPSGGIVGHRQLIAVQTIDLGRLTHHAVPARPLRARGRLRHGPGA